MLTPPHKFLPYTVDEILLFPPAAPSSEPEFVDPANITVEARLRFLSLARKAQARGKARQPRADAYRLWQEGRRSNNSRIIPPSPSPSHTPFTPGTPTSSRHLAYNPTTPTTRRVFPSSTPQSPATPTTPGRRLLFPTAPLPASATPVVFDPMDYNDPGKHTDKSDFIYSLSKYVNSRRLL